MSRSQLSFASKLSRLISLAAPLCTVGFFLTVCAFAAPEQDPQTNLVAQIDRDRSLIEDAARLNLTSIDLGSLWLRLGDSYADLMRYRESEDAYSHSLDLLEHTPNAKGRCSLALNNLSSLYMVTRRFDAAERTARHSIEVATQSADPVVIARAEKQLGGVYLIEGQNKKAVEHSRKAIPALRGDDRIAALLTYAHAACRNKHCDEAERAVHEAMDVLHASAAAEPTALAEIDLALGFIHQQTGAIAEAGENLHDGVRILSRDLPPTSPLLLGALEQYRRYLAENHRDVEAAAIAAREQPSQCGSCTINVRGLR